MFSSVVILAGGFGERLWPASKKDFPKQFLSLGAGRSFLQESLLRSCALKVQGKIFVITRGDIAFTCAKQIASLIDDNSITLADRQKLKKDAIVVAEPQPKHTATALLLSCILQKQLQEGSEDDDTILVLTSDHIIEPTQDFVLDCKKAHYFSLQKKFACFGIPPTGPATGYGYIKTGQAMTGDSTGCVTSIAQFKEKPDKETALFYLKSGGYLWNSGMFAFSADFFIKEMQKHSPQIASPFCTLIKDYKKKENLCFITQQEGINIIKNWQAIKTPYQKVEPLSVDVAILEKTKEAVCIKASFTWEDVGTWDTFCGVCKTSVGKNVQVEAKNNFIYSDIPVAVCGIDNLIVVIKNGCALVAKKGSPALVRDACKLMQEDDTKQKDFDKERIK